MVASNIRKSAGATTRIPKGVFNVHWKRHVANILSFFALDKRPKRLPRHVRLFGIENFRASNGKVYYRGREIVTDDERVKEILDAQESSYGGSKAIYYRLRKKYIGIHYSDVLKLVNESERRQLKRAKQSSNKQ